MWKAGLSLLCLCWSLSSFFVNAAPPWCPVQIGNAGWVSTGPTPGIVAANQPYFTTYDATLVPGSYRLAKDAGAALFGNAMCVYGNTSSPPAICAGGTKEDTAVMVPPTSEDQLCPNPIAHTYTFKIGYGNYTSDPASFIVGGAERTNCALGKADGHGHCVVNSCAAGTLAASGNYALGMSQTNTVTSSCIVANGNPCEATWQSTGALTQRLVAGQSNYFQQGKYVQTGNLCTTNAGPAPNTVALPSNTCAAGFEIYTDPATGVARCVVPGTGTPNPGDGTGAGGGGGGGAFPTSCPTWLGSVCSWFAETNANVEEMGHNQSDGQTHAGDAPQTFGDSTVAQMEGSKFFNGVDTRFDGNNVCPTNPSVSLPGGGVFIIPFEKVCAAGNMVHPIAAMISYLIAIGIALSGRST